MKGNGMMGSDKTEKLTLSELELNEVFTLAILMLNQAESILVRWENVHQVLEVIISPVEQGSQEHTVAGFELHVYKHTNILYFRNEKGIVIAWFGLYANWYIVRHMLYKIKHCQPLLFKACCATENSSF